MSEDSIDDDGRADCGDCGKNVAVNRDGSLRKHQCVDTGGQAVQVDTGEQTSAAGPLPDATAEAEPPEAEPLHTTEAAAEPLHTTRAEPQQLQTRPRRRYCLVANCGRSPRPDGLCAQHRLHTHLVS